MIINTIFLDVYDLIVTPLYAIAFILIIFLVSSAIKEAKLRKIFFWGITLKIVFAVLFGVVYDFFYGGGDTSAYWLYGTYIGDALWDSPIKWIKLLLYVDSDSSIYSYTSKIRWYSNDPASYFPCRIVGFFAPFCFNIYTTIAMFFAAINFSGLWVLFKTLRKRYVGYDKELAIAIFFIPSIVFWGSGIMKDGITLSALGWLFYGFHEIFILKNIKVKNFIFMFLAGWVLFIVKVYIILCFIPCAAIWLFLMYDRSIQNNLLKVIMKPVLLPVFLLLTFLATREASKFNKYYSLENIEKTATVTREYITFISERSGGSTYDIGALDFSFSGLVRIIPAAINVGLYRPYIWESKNAFMLLSALESSFMLFITIQVFVKGGFYNVIKMIREDLFIFFCIIFSLTFSFAIGISTNNFGTLTRYKIPLIPFYMAFILIVRSRVIQLNAQRKLQKQKKQF